MAGCGCEVGRRVGSGLKVRNHVGGSARWSRSAPCSRPCAGLLWAVLGGETKLENSMIMVMTLSCCSGLRGRCVGGERQVGERSNGDNRVAATLGSYEG